MTKEQVIELAKQAWPWLPADDKTAAECERLFQNGGPRVYEIWREGSRGLMPVTLSATRAARNLNPGGMVYARKKVGGKYEWMCVIRRSDEEQGK